MDVAILGSGVEGLLAAHAVTQSGHKPVIFGPEPVFRYRPYFGSTILREIPGITDQMLATTISITSSVGAPHFHAMAEKIYGPEDWPLYSSKYLLSEVIQYNRASSSYPSQPIWHYDIWHVYLKLKQLYGDNVNEATLTPKWYRNTGTRNDFDLVINTTYLPDWCVAGERNGYHSFVHSDLWMVVDAPYGPNKPDSVLLVPDPDMASYLQSNLHGRVNIEFPAHRKPPMDCKFFHRPLATDCDCAQRIFGFHNVGQMARFTHLTPVADVYYDTIDLIETHLNTPVQLELFR